MFKFAHSEVLRIINNDTDIISGITVCLRLENGKKLDLPFKKIEGPTAFFESDLGRATVTISQKDGIMALSASGELILNRKNGIFLDDADKNLSSTFAMGINFNRLCGLAKYNASYAVSAFWTQSSFGNDISKINDKTQALLYKTQSDSYVYALTLCDEHYKSQLEGNQNGGVTLKVYCQKRGHSRFNSKVLVMVFGDNPYFLPQRAVEFGLKFLNKIGGIRKARRYPEIFEYLGWCSWDAFPLCVSHSGLLEKAEEFKSKGIPVRWVIIDDMWAGLKTSPNTRENMHQNELSTFEADKERFPNGLKAAIDDIKEKYDLKVGVWHPITGYWHGFDKDGEIAKKYAHLLTETEDGRLTVSPELEKAFMFYNTFYNFLKHCGADFVKVDNQSCIEWFYKKLGTIGQIAKNLHMAIEAAVGVNFDGAIINCMGCASENLWNRPNSAVSRCSNDFLPEDRQWFIKHILQCSFNSYNHSPFVYPDWDMWWSDDGQAVKNSLLRAMSGGPIYVSDKVGRSKKEVIMPCVLSDGCILRCEDPAVPTKDCLLTDPETSKRIFKIWNKTKNGIVIAAFNLDENEEPVEGIVSPADTNETGDGDYVAFDYFNKSAFVLNFKDGINVKLNNYDQFSFFGFTPVVDGFSPIGLIDKYIASATFTRFAKGKYFVKDGGAFGFYCKNEPRQIICDGQTVVAKPADGFYVVDAGDKGRSHVLEFVF